MKRQYRQERAVEYRVPNKRIGEQFALEAFCNSPEWKRIGVEPLGFVIGKMLSEAYLRQRNLTQDLRYLTYVGQTGSGKSSCYELTYDSCEFAVSEAVLVSLKLVSIVDPEAGRAPKLP